MLIELRGEIGKSINTLESTPSELTASRKLSQGYRRHEWLYQLD